MLIPDPPQTRVPTPPAPRQRRPLRMLAAAAALLAASGCTLYSPLPLGNGAGAAQLTAPTAAMPLPALATHRFDPADGLDATEVAMLAVANSPDLRLKRDDLGLARAQAFAAGLLPDPQLGVSADIPRDSSDPALSKGYNLGISAEVSALLTRSSRRAAAREQVAQVNLDLLWAEWQTVAQARLLFNQVQALRAQRQLLETERAALTPIDRYIRAALNAGNLTYDSASAGLSAGADLQKRLTDNEIALHQASSDLHVLLGLAPALPLDLVGAPYRPTPGAAQVRDALATLPQRRPDLLALQAGYRSQEAKLRGAVLAQFPALNIGFNTARDTSAVYTNGFSIGITLPLFDRNRGNIAIEQATRRQLKDAYAARLLSTRSDMQRLLDDLATLQRQRIAATAQAERLDTARDAAQRTWQSGALDWPTYLAIRASALNADLDRLGVQQELAKQAIALEVLLGTPAADGAQTPSTQASRP